MAIHLKCPNGHHLTAKESNAGRTGKCPVCKTAVQIPDVQSDRLTESAVLDILGTPEPRTGSFSPGTTTLATQATTIQRPATVVSRNINSSALPISKICPNCDRDIDVGYHICPHCHTYLTGLSEF